MNWIDYREKLGIGFNDFEKFQLLKHKVCTFLRYVDNCISISDYINPTYINYFILTGYGTPDMNINGVLQSMTFCDSMKELISKYIAFVNTASKHIANKQILDEIRDFLPSELTSLHIPYTLLEDSDGLFIFPKGSKELDDALVSQPLEWLSEYPKAQKTFCIALRQYSEGVYVRDVADNLRKSLEEFLREFLKNDCDLNRNKKEVETYLKSENADSQLIQMFVSLMTHYYLLNNEIAKHNDKTDARYLEFPLYQTGLFIRMLIVIKQSH